MASRNNIGKVRSALEAGQKALANINFNPIMEPTFTEYDYTTIVTDATFEQDTSNGYFIWGIHRWGDSKHKIGI